MGHGSNNIVFISRRNPWTYLVLLQTSSLSLQRLALYRKRPPPVSLPRQLVCAGPISTLRLIKTEISLIGRPTSIKKDISSDISFFILYFFPFCTSSFSNYFNFSIFPQVIKYPIYSGFGYIWTLCTDVILCKIS